MKGVITTEPAFSVRTRDLTETLTAEITASSAHCVKEDFLYVETGQNVSRPEYQGHEDAFKLSEQDPSANKQIAQNHLLLWKL
jgi:hypothetical protein